MYNPLNDTWTEESPMPTARKILAATADLQGHVYAIGGDTGAGSVVYATVERFTPPVTLYTFRKD
jgi:hypothetical protein